MLRVYWYSITIMIDHSHSKKHNNLESMGTCRRAAGVGSYSSPKGILPSGISDRTLGGLGGGGASRQGNRIL